MKILIAGATGLIGKELVRQCHEVNIAVHYLTTSKEKIQQEPQLPRILLEPQCW